MQAPKLVFWSNNYLDSNIMTTSDYENPKKYLHDADHQVDDPNASFEVKVEMCKATVATNLPYYQKQKDEDMVNF